MTVHALDHEPPAPMVVVGALLLVIPLLLAAELAQRSNALPHLPEQDTYRSNLSKQILKSSKWRKPPPPDNSWRTPASPQIEWRSGTPQESPRSQPHPNAELYPDYKIGGTSTFDLSTREDQTGIKLFEFDLGR